MRRRALAPLVLALCTLAIEARAHGTRIMLSTPTSPPAGYEWIPPVALVLFVALNVFLIRWIAAARWRTAVLTAVVAVSLSGVAFFYFGRTAANSSTAPPPGLGWGASVHWGLGWSDVGDLFIKWNLIGAIFLATGLGILCLARGIRGWRKIVPLLGANLALYLVCLMPYVCPGALSHGWPGSYTHLHCRSQLSSLGKDVLRHLNI